jgi:hypothetical protein
MNKTLELVKVAEENQLTTDKVQEFSSQFSESFSKARAIAEEAKSILVTDISQTKEMQQARQKRLELKNIRVAVEHTRKELKEQSLREGKAIDGMANIIKALIVPVEEHLEKQEQYAAMQAAKAKAERLAKRTAALANYVEDTDLYNLNDMEDAQFDVLLANSKKSFEDEKAAAEQAEKERLEREEAERKEQEQIRKDNERLRAEAEAREKAMEAERQKLAAENAAKLEAERKKALAEREAREKLEEERRQREEAEAKAQAEAEETERQKLLAPDKEKLIAFANVIDALTLPSVATREAGKVLDETQDFLTRISKNLRQKAREL